MVIDQFEEVWTACTDEGERSTFLDTIGTLAADADSGITLVLVLRADSSRISPIGDSSRRWSRTTRSWSARRLPTMSAARLSLPAARAGLVFDDGLVDALVSDAGAEPGLLPLLSTALSQLWEARDGHRLGFDAYVRLGGLDSAIRHLAETTYAGLDPAGRGTMRDVLMRLAGGRGATGSPAARATLGELTRLPAADVRSVLDTMVAARHGDRRGRHGRGRP